MFKRIMLVIAGALVVNAPALAAAPMMADGVRAAAAAEASSAEKFEPVAQRSRPQPYECKRFYWPCYHYGYYQFYGVWGPIGYWGLYRPYARDPWSWWKFP